MGSPLRMVIQASSKLAAEEQAARLGFGDAWANPVTDEEAKQAQWKPIHREDHRQAPARYRPGIRV